MYCNLVCVLFANVSLQDITHMCRTLERLFDQKILSMPKEVGFN